MATDGVNSTYQFVNNENMVLPPPEFPTLNSRRDSSLKNHWYVDIKLELSDNGGGVCFSGEAHGRTKRGSEQSTKLEQSSQKSAKSEDCPLMADDR